MCIETEHKRGALVVRGGVGVQFEVEISTLHLDHLRACMRTMECVRGRAVGAENLVGGRTEGYRSRCEILHVVESGFSRGVCLHTASTASWTTLEWALLKNNTNARCAL